ncbi:MAG: hypothetical protein JNL43_13420 [Flavobacteriales bacterium]|nr:hypothetical protein [Flavobacteriales bacterium]
MKDELELLWTGLKVRVKDTFTSTFFIAWVLWNWRALLYIVYPMSMDLDSRLNHIEFNIYAGAWKPWLLLCVGPLVSTLFFLLVLPRWVNRIDKTYQAFLVERRKAQVEAQATLFWTAEEVEQVLEKNKALQLEIDEVRKRMGEISNDMMGMRQNLQRAQGDAAMLRQNIDEAGLGKARMSGYRG